MKREFLISTITMLMVSAFAWAQEYRELTPPQRLQYGEAAVIAVGSSRLSCNLNGSARSTLMSGQELLQIGNAFSARAVIGVYLNSELTQPLLKLVALTTLSERSELEIESNADRTGVVSVKKTNSRRGRVNVGTLDNPNIVYSWVVTSTYECRALTEQP